MGCMFGGNAFMVVESPVHAEAVQVWKPAIGSLAPARSALRALPSLR